MAQRQFRIDDTSPWGYRYGNASAGSVTQSSSITDTSRTGYANTSISVNAASKAATFGAGTGFSDGDLIIISQYGSGGDGCGAWELNRIESGGGTTSVTLTYDACNNYSSRSQVYRLVQYLNYTMANTLYAPAWDGTKGGLIAIMCNNKFSGTSWLYASNAGHRGGHEGNEVLNCKGASGEGTSGGPGANDNQENVNMPPYGTGGGGGFGRGAGAAGGGGGGGHATNGASGLTNGGSGAGTGGSSDLKWMIPGGGGGGGGSAPNNNSSYYAGGGRPGGGIIIIIAREIEFSGGSGGADANGQSGGNPNHSGEECGGGGGGAGGAILLIGQRITMGTYITATGGGGGAGSNSNENGGAGGTGRIYAAYGQTISGSTNPSCTQAQDGTLNDFGGAAMLSLL